MKKYFTIMAIILVSFTSAHAFDLGKVVSGTKDATCAALAIDLVKSAGVGAMNLFTKLSADGALTSADLGVSDKTLAEATGYISSGCAKDHLTKALSAVVN